VAHSAKDRNDASTTLAQHNILDTCQCLKQEGEMAESEKQRY